MAKGIKKPPTQKTLRKKAKENDLLHFRVERQQEYNKNRQFKEEWLTRNEYKGLKKIQVIEIKWHPFKSLETTN